jgi:hypothetical protein
MPELQGALDIRRMEDAFEGCLIGLEIVDYRSDFLMNDSQAKRKVIGGIEANDAASRLRHNRRHRFR